MDAKLWAEEYNRHKPPKKVQIIWERVTTFVQVDIFMMAVIELVDRPDRPLYHVEHYMGGDYIKVAKYKIVKCSLSAV